MSARLVGSLVMVMAAVLATACSDDEEKDGCAHVQELCDGAGESADCSMFDEAPKELQDCLNAADSCEGVVECLAEAAGQS